jgi:hypothetical protein
MSELEGGVHLIDKVWDEEKQSQGRHLMGDQ